MIVSFNFDHTTLDAGQVQHAVDQSGQSINLVIDESIKLVCFLWFTITVNQHFNVGFDSRHGSFEFMCDGGDEFGVLRFLIGFYADIFNDDHGAQRDLILICEIRRNRPILV